MKRIYACFAIVAALLATAFYSSFQVQRFADDISTDLDCAIEAIRTSDLPSARQALARGADRCDRMREKMNHLLRTEDFTELEAALRTADGHLGQNAPEDGAAPVPDSAPAAQPETPQTDTTESAPEPAETM